MAYPDPNPWSVSPQITDAVTQANVKVLGDGPAIAMGTIYQSLAQATGLMFQNAVATQNSQNILQQAATTQGVIQIYSVDTLSDADAATALSESLVKILQAGNS
jgi:hypothetical protein